MFVLYTKGWLISRSNIQQFCNYLIIYLFFLIAG